MSTAYYQRSVRAAAHVRQVEGFVYHETPMRVRSVVALAGLVVVACSKASTPTNTPAIDCSGTVSVSPSSATLHLGDTLRAVAKDTPCPAGPSTATFRWRSSDTTIANVDSIAGLVRARSIGHATIIGTETGSQGVQVAMALEVVPYTTTSVFLAARDSL